MNTTAPSFRLRWLTALCAFGLLRLGAQPLHAAEADSLPPENLIKRSAKIVEGLNLANEDQIQRVTLVIARNYESLSKIHDQRDAALQAARSISDVETRESAEDAASDTATARMADQIAIFLGQLAADLDSNQIDAVKDGLTYGVLPKTFRVYQEMLPDMTPEQSRQIYAWLYEAREHAISAGSSDAKHGWFGKYKGRINNYLAKAGIDMKAAEKAMFERKKAAAN